MMVSQTQTQTLLTCLRPLMSCCMNFTEHSPKGGR